MHEPSICFQLASEVSGVSMSNERVMGESAWVSGLSVTSRHHNCNESRHSCPIFDTALNGQNCSKGRIKVGTH